VKLIKTNEEAKALLQKTFKDSPMMIEVARCESNFRQWDEKGEVLKGIVNPLDTGAFQINKHYHLKTAIKMGLDIDTAEGNISYAKHLHDNEGTRPWNASRKCWSPRSD
jgi:hypothetical protein